MEFLFLSGSNRSNPVDLTKIVTYTDQYGVRRQTTAADYLSPQNFESLGRMDDRADALLSYGAIYQTQANEFAGLPVGRYEKDDFVRALDPIRESLTNTEGFFDADGNKVYDDEVNLPVFYRGGGYNGSDVRLDPGLQSLFQEEISLDPYVYSLDLRQDPVPDFGNSPTGKYQAMKIAMLRAASNVTGFHPYRFLPLEGHPFQGENPNLQDFRDRASLLQ